jgi:hypothetical protein
MDVINYENAIKNMFNRNKNNSSENEINQNQISDNKTAENLNSKTSQLKTIKSLYSNDKKLKDNNENNLLNSVDLTNSNEHEIDLENSIINSLNYKENNIQDDSEDEKLDIQSKLLINKLQNGIQTNKKGEIIINSNSDIHKKKNDDLNKENKNNNNNNNKKNTKLILSNKNNNSSKIHLSKNNSNNFYYNKNNFVNKTIQNFSYNKYSSHKKKINSLNNFTEKKKNSSINNKNLITNPSSLTNKTMVKNYDPIENKFEAYNLDNLAYDAIKKYSKFKPKNFSFYERMKFYAIKQQTKNYMINMMINKAKTKMKETEKILTFNRLINDSNRRSEAKNRIELLNSNNKIANELYDTENLVMKTKKKKFDPIQFDKKYKENVINYLKEKEHSLNLLRQQKEIEKNEKEQQEINEMKKYNNKKATNKQIEAISQRLYTEANIRKLKSNINSRDNSTLKNKINQINNNKFKHKRIKSSKNSYYMKTNSKTDFFSENNLIKNKDNENKNINKNNKLDKKTKKFIPYNSAEKMVDLFFENLNKK